MMGRPKIQRNLFPTNVYQRLMTVQPTLMRQIFEKKHPEKKL
jgi:hypothetical protein